MVAMAIEIAAVASAKISPPPATQVDKKMQQGKALEPILQTKDFIWQDKVVNNIWHKQFYHCYFSFLAKIKFDNTFRQPYGKTK